MSDLISKSALWNAILTEGEKGLFASRSLEEIVDEQPTIEAEPVKHGRWIADTYWHGYHCSLCGNQRSYIEVQVINYCPNCGARMDEVENG